MQDILNNIGRIKLNTKLKSNVIQLNKKTCKLRYCVLVQNQKLVNISGRQ